METSLQNISTSDLEQYVLARYLRTRAEGGLIGDPPSKGVGSGGRTDGLPTV